MSGVLLANKKDLEEDGRRVISREEGEKYAKAFKFKYFETSAVSHIMYGCKPHLQKANLFSPVFSDHGRGDRLSISAFS